MRIALVHDFFCQYGGAERVLEALHDLYPQAPVYLPFHDPRTAPPTWRRWEIRTSFLQRFPAWKRFFRLYLLWYPLAFESFDLRGYDLILSSSSAFAKGVIPAPGARHICYCHNPARFLWTPATYLERERLGRAARILLAPALSRLRVWDLSTNDRVDAFIANSRTVAQRIARFYRRESTVIHPPVAVGSFPLAKGRGRYFLTGGRLVPHKRFDVAIQACSIVGLPLVVFGEGRDRRRLEALAGPTVKFVGRVSEEKLRELYLDCRAFLFPSEEDLGIGPIEAMACGRPVIAYAAGGALETVVPGRTGILFSPQRPEALVEVLAGFREEDFDPSAIRQHAEQFDTSVFRQRIAVFVSTAMEDVPGAQV
ncbi:MAG: glycosyltransferase [Chloroflexia bacterium]